MKIIKLLIADDSMMMRDIINEIIHEDFPEVHIYEAADGLEAQKMLQKEHIDAVLCDWEMPGMNGIGLLQWVRETPSLKTLPFIMVTGTTEKECIVQCIKAGVTDYIVKPLTPETLIHKISKFIKAGQ